MKKQKLNNKQTSQHTSLITQKGITLVALVITIIVLLILAGVAINMAINSDGLFGKANEAVDIYSDARKNESYEISSLQDILSELETGVSVEKVTDTNPGVLETDVAEENTYIINSIEDLVFFSYDVKQGKTYEGKTVKLGTSLDFNSTKSYVDALREDYSKYGYNGELKLALTTESGFQSIGTIEDSSGANCFKGTFEGNNNSIYNLYISSEPEDSIHVVGLFGGNFGTIENLNVENIKITALTTASTFLVGGICGRNAGTITKCSISGEMNLTNNAEGKMIHGGGLVGQAFAGSIDKSCNRVNINVVANKGTVNIGGIAGYNQGDTVDSCYNSGNIVIDTLADSQVNVGGIIARAGKKELKNFYNTGDITVNGTSTKACVGGVGGEVANLVNSINFGKITANSDSLNLGGVLGYSYQGTVNNIYNIGTISGEGTTSNYRGLLLGRIHTATLTNGYYKEQGEEVAVGNNYNGTVENINTLTTDIDALSILGSAFVADTKNINKGYPILSWQQTN